MEVIWKIGSNNKFKSKNPAELKTLYLKKKKVFILLEKIRELNSIQTKKHFGHVSTEAMVLNLQEKRNEIFANMEQTWNKKYFFKLLFRKKIKKKKHTPGQFFIKCSLYFSVTFRLIPF